MSEEEDLESWDIKKKKKSVVCCIRCRLVPPSGYKVNMYFTYFRTSDAVRKCLNVLLSPYSQSILVDFVVFINIHINWNIDGGATQIY